jgi:rare lipoprotein A (peptidoglycan hydrolase)
MRRAAISLMFLATASVAAEAGNASLYSNAHHGRKTASGERFDKNALTAAHRTLPFGANVRVTNKSNNRSVVVRINAAGLLFADGSSTCRGRRHPRSG